MESKELATHYEPMVSYEETSSYNPERNIKMKPIRQFNHKYYWKYFRQPPTACCQQRPNETNKKLRLCRRRVKKNVCCMEESTSVDESISSYTSALSVDVSQEMAAVNRDIEEIIRKCDKYCGNEYSKRHLCDRKLERAKLKNSINYYNLRDKLTAEQLRILTMEKPPLEKLKEVPVGLLRPRAPNRKPVKPNSARHKTCTAKEMSSLVDETDTLLRNVYEDLVRSRVKKKCTHRHHHDCSVKSVFGARPGTCLGRYLGCQRKEERDWTEMVAEVAHVHDTNCIEDPTCKRSSSRPKTNLIEKGVNTVNPQETENSADSAKSAEDPIPPQKANKGTQKAFPSDFSLAKELAPHFKPILSSSRLGKDIVAYNLTVERGLGGEEWQVKREKEFNKTSQVDSGCSDQRLSAVSDQSHCFESNSLLLNRNINLNLDTSGQLVQDSHLDAIILSQKIPSGQKAIGLPEANESSEIRLPGAGDSKAIIQTTHGFISKVISQVVMKHDDNSTNGRNSSNSQNGCNEKIDSGLCIEIIRRLTELMLEKPSEAVSKQTLTIQLNKLKEMRTDCLKNIESQIKKIVEIDIYLGSL